MTILTQREVLSCPLYWSIVFPFLVNCRVSAFRRVLALLRTDGDHEQKLVFTRLFALPPIP